MSTRAAYAATKITVGRCRWWGLHKFGVPIKMISLKDPSFVAELSAVIEDLVRNFLSFVVVLREQRPCSLSERAEDCRAPLRSKGEVPSTREREALTGQDGARADLYGGVQGTGSKVLFPFS